MHQSEIIFYGRERYSPVVQRVRERLLVLDLQYVEHDIEANESAGDDLEELTGKRQVPTVVIGPRVLIEPSIAELDAALRDAGYPVIET